MWQFWIDVGGTFTDCVARSPDGTLRTHKTLSSGVTKGLIESRLARSAVSDPRRREDPPHFWEGSTFRIVGTGGISLFESQVVHFDADSARLTLADPLTGSVGPRANYELIAPHDAPVLAIRYLLRLRPDEPIPPVQIRLGTTRGTNALLERKGARTAFITTAGFADVLLIANQDRPRLFDLDIEKPQPLFSEVLEIDERIDAGGQIVLPIDERKVRAQLLQLKEAAVDSIAICLLHAYVNARHEQTVERVARELGFQEVSTSSRVAPLIKAVSRGDTTVMDAYLNPVLRDYVGRIRAALDTGAPASDRRGPPDGEPPGSSRSAFQIMTSAGGLVDADRFVGKDSILSGPAGGVIGFSRIAQQAGFEKSIGFDMGGTSTDVSRFDGRYELEFETRKAGVRVVAPMLAIETVAAGGGSICRFDGVKLIVGPESAGSDPGPACYGRGGPLTVTDANLALGRLIPSRFPFQLDTAAVERRLQELCRQVAASPMGRHYTTHQLAQGFIDIANASMARAIRRVSVGRGYNPAEYALTTFGGAGGQHACALARELNAKCVIIHPFAGVLSAYGMGLADVRRFAERSVLKTWTPATLQELEPKFAEMEDRLRAEVSAEGISSERIGPGIRSLDMRYRGGEGVINVLQPPDGNYPAAYESLHQQLYGYRRPGREIEVTAARMEVVARSPVANTARPAAPRAPSAAPPLEPVAAERVTTWFGGRPLPTSVYLREVLKPGDRIAGPAIICESTSTTIVDPGFHATLLGEGEILIEAKSGAPRSGGGHPEQPPASPDPVMLEIFNNLFASVAEQMGVTLQKTSVSTNVKERLDFSCAVFDSQGNLVVNAPHIPVHLGAMSETVKAILADHPDMQPGDVFVTNDPYRGGSHLPDVTVVTPVYIDHRPPSPANEESARAGGDGPSTLPLRPFLVASRAHHAEIGGIVPGSMPPFSRRLAEEGVLIRSVKFVDRGEVREEQLRNLLLSAAYPSRNADDNLSDIAAQVAANQSGVNLLHQLVGRYSLPVVESYMGFIQQAAAAKMRLALAAIPDGVYRLTDHLDDGTPISVCVTIAGDKATVDFTGTGPVLDTNLNANRAIVTAAVMYVFRCLIAEDIPLNGGVLEPVEIVLPQCLLNPGIAPVLDDSPAVVGGNVETSQRVVDVLLGALQLAAASQGTMNNLAFGDGSFGYYETICGGAGATANADGADAVHTHMTNTRLTDVEVIERRYPVRVRQFSIRRGSGGSGRRRGGDGIVREIEFLRPLTVSVLSQRRGPFPPFGLVGGAPGRLGRNTLVRNSTGDVLDLGGSFQIEALPGDVLTIETPGGGGFGPSPGPLGSHSDRQSS